MLTALNKVDKQKNAFFSTKPRIKDRFSWSEITASLNHRESPVS